MTTLAELITVKSQQTCFDEMIATLKASGFPTTGWQTTSVPRRILWAVSGVYSAMTSTAYNMAAGGLLELSTGDWLTLLAASMYQEARVGATFAVGTVTIADRSSAGPYTIAVNQLWFSTANGKRFYNTTGGTLALNGKLELTVAAEYAGASFNVAEDSIINMDTSLPGVSTAQHTTIKSAGTTPPTITVSGTPAGGYDFQIEVTTGGARGTAQFRWRSSVGGSWTTGVATAATTVFGATGCTVAWPVGTYFTDNVYTWSSQPPAASGGSYNPTPDWLTTVAVDDQTDDDLRETCRQKWSTLGYGHNDDWFRYWIRKVPTYGATITRNKIETVTTGHSTIEKSGAGIPTITAAWTTAPTSQPQRYLIEVETTGARGASTFKYSQDDGVTWTATGVTTAATVALTGGVTISMPTGTYTDGDVYRWTSAACLGQVTLGTATGGITSVARDAVDDFSRARIANSFGLHTQPSESNTIAVTATIYARTGTATEAQVVAGATAGINAYLERLAIGETAYMDQIKDAIIYDSSVIRNLTLTLPAADATMTTYQCAIAGTITLTVSWV